MGYKDFYPQNFFTDEGSVYLAWSKQQQQHIPNPTWFQMERFETVEMTLPIIPEDVTTKKGNPIVVSYNLRFQSKALATPIFDEFFNVYQKLPNHLQTILWQRLQTDKNTIEKISLWSTLLCQVETYGTILKKRTAAKYFDVIVDDPVMACFLGLQFSGRPETVHCFQNPSEYLKEICEFGMDLLYKQLEEKDKEQILGQVNSCTVYLDMNCLGQYPNITKNVLWIGAHEFPKHRQTIDDDEIECSTQVFNCILDKNYQTLNFYEKKTKVVKMQI